MAQTTYNSELAPLTEGQIVYNRLNSDINSFAVGDAKLGFGRFCMRVNDTAYVVRSNAAELTLDGDLGASNVLAGTVTVTAPDGTVNVVPFTETYAASHVATMTALTAELDAIPNITAVNTASRVIALTADNGYSVVINSAAVTGGSAVAVTLTNEFAGVVYGPSVAAENAPDCDGDASFRNKDAVGLMRKGYIAVAVDGAIATGAVPYIRIVEEVGEFKKLGMLTTTAGSAPVKAIDASDYLYIERGTTGPGYAIVAVNRP